MVFCKGENTAGVFNTGRIKSAGYRIRSIKKLRREIKKREDEMFDALYADLEKSGAEAYMSEIIMVCSETDEKVSHFRKWMRPVNLSLSPLVHTVAAGNCVVIKCSKNSRNTSEMIRDMINDAFPADHIACLDEASVGKAFKCGGRYVFLLITFSCMRVSGMFFQAR